MTAKLFRVALVQNSAGREMGPNLGRLDELTGGITGADLIALPEVFAVRGDDADYIRAREPLGGPTVAWLKNLAKRAHAWVLGGSIVEADGDDTFNTAVLVDRLGNIAACYRKIHLFEAVLDTGQVVREKDAYSAGNSPCMVNIEGWPAGLSICYDLRFPELYRAYSAQNAALLFVPSNFTQRTGKDHWNVLVRARAIENQCFVIAPNQCGINPATGVESHGHSIAAGPWGEILCEAGTEETVVYATLDPAMLKEVRRRIPVLEHRTDFNSRAGR